jgi:phosphotransferase system enzyme I (PtsI)
MQPAQLLSVKQQILRADRPRLMREVDRLLHACEPTEIQDALGALARA